MSSDLKELDGSALIKLASEAATTNDYEASLPIFSELIRRTNSELGMPLLSRATSFIQLKRYEEAIEDLLLCLKLKDSDIEEGLVKGSSTFHSAVYARLHRAYTELDQLEEAGKYLKLRSELEDQLKRKTKPLPLTDSKPQFSNSKNIAQTPINKKAEGINLKAKQLIEEDKFNKAIEFYNLSLKVEENQAKVHSNLSYCHLRLNDAKQALFHANECTLLEPEWAKGYFRQGMALKHLKEYNESKKSFQSALLLQPEDPATTNQLIQLNNLNSNLSNLVEVYLMPTFTVLVAIVCIGYIVIGM